MSAANRDEWTMPGVYEVAPGVYRIPLPLPMQGLTAVNSYLFTGADGLVYVDPGFSDDANRQAIERAFAELGHSISDITTCIATHHHWDHYAQAYAWRGEIGSKLYIGHEERHSILGFDLDAEVRYPTQTEQLAEAGAQAVSRAIAEGEPSEMEQNTPYGPPDGWLSGGDRIELADGGLEVIATPGHTRGHVILRHTASGVLVTGDHVLPFITPSIGFEWSPEPQPLQSFLRSLGQTLELPDGALLPAHGPVLGSTHARVKEQIAHHDERLAEVLELIGRRPSSSYEVARQMKWTRRARALDDLPVEHQMIAISEIRAHLEMLRLQGRAQTVDDDGVLRYAPASDQNPRASSSATA
ncbi:MBL fold metallo-hydrolase [Jongsikchunia kroppenstedtii]|uniref:MBL fold metallo-hydrolase n=1 Tax=Jongsikchunia kroppenstedtii TaxID=1121721 RepID=UPI0003A1971E|nr:MBL fold metallo-hydrolase [Jongsikchunia kroppenstedtii]